jgi:beta-lactamase regulating signal transducer with metallopeptidase domain
MGDKVKEIFTKTTEISDIALVVENPTNTADITDIILDSHSIFYNIFDMVDRFGRDMFERIETINTAGTDIITRTTESTAAQFSLNISPLLVVWLVGFICCAAYFIIGHIKFRSIYEVALPIDNTFIRGWRVEYSDSMRRKVKIKQSELIDSPLAYGIFRPVILLPKTTDYDDETTLRYILLHEYTHIRRFDIFAKLLIMAALCVHWFNPFVWLMYILANRDIELSCDETVVRKSDISENKNYASALVALEEKKSLLALGVNFSRNIMNERIQSILNIKKKSKIRIIAAIILTSMMIVMFAALQSCENIMDIIDFEDEDFEMQEQTDKLVVYMTIDNDWFLTPAINIFREKYPDIEVEIVAFDLETEHFEGAVRTIRTDEFNTRLTTELAAGRGPDLVLALVSDFPDIYKTMMSGIFADLNHFITHDSGFNIEEYNQVVLDAGVFQGKRSIMPIGYTVPKLFTTQEILDAEGINPADLNTFDGFIRIALNFNEKYADNPNKSVFLNSQTNSGNIRNFFPHSGINLIDYQTNTVGADKAQFKSIIDIMKKTYVRDERISARTNMWDYEGLRDRNQLFSIESTIGWIFYDTNERLVINDDLTPRIFSYPNIDNGVTAEVQYFAAIPKSSENQINAYNLLKIILSEDIQRERYLFELPVLKNAVKPSADEAMRMMGLLARFEETIDEYVNMAINVTSAKIMPHVPYREFLIEEMTPYFESSRTFDDAYSRLVSKLELYLSE